AFHPQPSQRAGLGEVRRRRDGGDQEAPERSRESQARAVTRCRAALLAALIVTGRPAIAQDAPLPSSVLAVRDDHGDWREFWTSASAPVVWRSAPLVDVMTWKKGASGIEWGELQLRGAGEAWRTRLVVARVDPT